MLKRIPLAALAVLGLVALGPRIALAATPGEAKPAAEAKRSTAEAKRPAADAKKAESQSSAGTTRHTFKSMDRNADGRLSRDEARVSPKLAERFDRVDGNRDGFLTREEIKSSRTAKRTTSTKPSA
jgi:Ca2+-binding EF-hand superfamily protein